MGNETILGIFIWEEQFGVGISNFSRVSFRTEKWKINTIIDFFVSIGTLEIFRNDKLRTESREILLRFPILDIVARWWFKLRFNLFSRNNAYVIGLGVLILRELIVASSVQFGKYFFDETFLRRQQGTKRVGVNDGKQFDAVEIQNRRLASPSVSGIVIDGRPRRWWVSINRSGTNVHGWEGDTGKRRSMVKFLSDRMDW